MRTPIKKKPPTKLQTALKTLISALNEDKDYRETWKANIAMSFKDNLNWYKKTHKRHLNKEDFHTISNLAADQFLYYLTH